MTLFIISSFCLVSANTIIFTFDISKIFTGLCPPANESTEFLGWNDAVKNQSKAIRLLVCTIILSVSVIAVVAYHCYNNLPKDQWKTILHWVEIFSFFMFLLFTYVDKQVLTVCSLLIDKKVLSRAADISTIKSFQKNTKLFYHGSDLPGVFGMLFILLVSYMLSPALEIMFWEGLVVGAMGLHMAFSQSSLVFLSICSQES